MCIMSKGYSEIIFSSNNGNGAEVKIRLMRFC